LPPPAPTEAEYKREGEREREREREREGREQRVQGATGTGEMVLLQRADMWEAGASGTLAVNSPGQTRGPGKKRKQE
jgi:hypothetical protein